MYQLRRDYLAPPNYQLEEYLEEVKANQGFSEKYNQHLKATGEKIEEVEIAIALQSKIVELAEIKRRQAYLMQSAETIKYLTAEELEARVKMKLF